MSWLNDIAQQFDGKYYDEIIGDERKSKKHVNYNEEQNSAEKEEEFYQPFEAKNKQRAQKKQKEKREESTRKNTKNNNNPKGNQGIGQLEKEKHISDEELEEARFVSENRNKSYIMEEIETLIEKDNIAAYAIQESGLFQEEIESQKIKNCLCFFYATSKQENLDAIREQKEKKLKLELDREEDEHKKTQIQAKINNINNKHNYAARKQGLALILNKKNFNYAELLNKSANNITVKATLVNNKQIIISNVYGPPGSVAENNKFWEDKMFEDIKTISNMTLPHVILTDANSILDINKDRISESQTPFQKLKFRETMEAHQYQDIWRKQHQEVYEYTYERTGLRERLDYILVNQKWREVFPEKNTKTKISAGVSDHNKVTMTIPLKEKKIKEREPKPKYLRTLNEEQIKEFNKNLKEEIERENPLYPSTKFSMMTHNMGLLIDQLKQDPKEIKKPEIPQTIRTLRKARDNKQIIYKLKTLTTPQVSIGLIKESLDTETQPRKQKIQDDQAIKSIYKKITRRNTTLRTKFNKGLPISEIREEWIQTFVEERKEIEKLLNKKNTRHKRNRIKKAVTKILDNKNVRPKEFWKKMGNKKKSNTTIEALKVNKQKTNPDTGETFEETSIITEDEEILKAAQEEQEQTFKSRKEISKEELRQWKPEHVNNEKDEIYRKAIQIPTQKEILKIIKKGPDNKATGGDLVSYEIIKQLTQGKEENITLKTIVDMMIAIFKDEADIPEEWKQGDMILIHKAGDESILSNYRPITLLQTIYKIYSSWLKGKLQTFFEEREISAKCQSGFRSGLSTKHGIYAMKEMIRHAQVNHKSLHAAMLDYSKAFDSIEHDHLDTVLSSDYYGIPEELGNAVKNTYRNRKTSLILPQGKTEQFDVGKGVPQGDPLSPILFIIAINPLLQRLEKEEGAKVHGINYPVSAFCDDTNLHANTKEQLENLWNIVLEFSQVTNLNLNAKKTVYAANKHVKDFCELKYNGITIPALEAGKYFKSLGAYFNIDNDETFQKSKISGFLQADLVRIGKKKITPIIFVEVIKKITHPTIEYPMFSTTYTEEELKKLQARITIAVKNKFKITDSYIDDWLEIDTNHGGLGIPSIQTLYKCQKIGSFLQIIRGPNCKAKDIAISNLRREKKEGDLKTVKSDTESHWRQVNRLLKLIDMELSSKYKYTSKDEMVNIIESTVNLNEKIEELEQILQLNKTTIIDQFFQTNAQGNKTIPQDESLNYFQLDENDNRALNEAQRMYNEYEDKSTPNEIHNITQKSKPKDITFENKEVVSGKLIEKEGSKIHGKIYYTDGSAKDDKASYAISTSTMPTQFYSQNKGRIEGKQDNYRAELTAILGVLIIAFKSQISEHPQLVLENEDMEDEEDPNLQHIIIGTDSESSIKAIESFHEKSISERLKVNNRDLIIDIRNQINRLKQEKNLITTMIHIPAHTNETDKIKNKEEKEKVTKRRDTFKEEIGNGRNFDRMIKGNETADAAAEEGRINGKPHARNWKKTPTSTVEDFYLIEKAEDKQKIPNPAQIEENKEKWILVQESIFKKAKGIARNQALKRRKDNPGKRGSWLKYEENVDLKRSFQLQNSTNHNHHKTAVYLWKRRMHNLGGAKDMRLKIQKLTKSNKPENDTWIKYYEYLAPDKTCYLCKQKAIEERVSLNDVLPVTPEEDTEHCFECPAVPGKREIFEKTWEKIRKRMKKKGAKEDMVGKLYPFLASTKEMRDDYLVPQGDDLPFLREVSQYGRELRAAALIPRNLHKALGECGLRKEEAEEMASWIAAKVQFAEQEAHALRRKAFFEGKEQKRAFREIIQEHPPPPGKEPLISPPNVPVPHTDTINPHLLGMAKFYSRSYE